MRREVLEDGELKKIAQVLLEPALRNKPKQTGLKQWLEYIFNTQNRPIIQYHVITPFKMPGVFHVTPTVKWQGKGPRNAKLGEEIWVRFDGDVVDVEICATGKASGWFSMDRVTFGRIEGFLAKNKKTDDACKKY